MWYWNGSYWEWDIFGWETGGRGGDTGNGNGIAGQLPERLRFVEDQRGTLDLSDLDLGSLGGKNDIITLTFEVSSGALFADRYGPIDIAGSGTGTVTLSGKVKHLERYLDDAADALSYLGDQDAFGEGAGALSIRVGQGSTAEALGSVSIDLDDRRDDIVGTEGDDDLSGDGGMNGIYGLGGDDSLQGHGGDDLIEAGDGCDTVSGGAGADTLDGGAGEDVLYYYGSQAGVRIDLGAGTASGGDAEGDVISGFEHIYGSNAADVLTGDAGGNTLFGYGGADVINGMGGDDVIRGGAGADTLDGGDGTDWLRYLGSREGVTISLEPGTVGSGGDAEGDVVTNFENIQGSDHGDVLTGDAGANEIIGNDGDDAIFGGAGKDRLRGGEGADTLDGGAGVDTVLYVGSDAGVTVNLRTGSGTGGEAEGDVISNVENVYGSDHGDLLIGGAGRNYLYGYDGDDTISGGEGKDVLRGMAGADSFLFDTAPAASNVDRILDFTAGTDNILLDGAIFDTLTAGALLESQFLVAQDGVAQTADQRMIYDSGDGTLYYDADGSGALDAIAVAQLTNRADLSFDDILIV